VLAVQASGDLVVECEGVPGEPPARPEEGGGALEGTAAVGHREANSARSRRSSYLKA
jgi:hypothetical protein